MNEAVLPVGRLRGSRPSPASPQDAGVEVGWVRADIASEPPARRRYGLVSVLYPALRHTPGDDAIQSIIDAVAPGGTLLVVGHDLDGSDHHRHRGFDPSDYVRPADVARHLDAAWTIEVQETLRELIDGATGR